MFQVCSAQKIKILWPDFCCIVQQILTQMQKTAMATEKKTENHNNDIFKTPDPVALGQAIMDAYEKAQPLFENYIQKYGSADAYTELSKINFDPLNVRTAYFEFLDRITQNPDKFFEIQAEYAQDWMNLWQDSMRRFMGESVAPIIEPDSSDRRFKAPEWQESAVFNFIKQSYLLASKQLESVVYKVDGLSDNQREKLAFQTKLFTNALSPTNFLMTNPEVLNETMRTGGENLVKGFENLIRDLERGQGELNIRTTNHEAFELGRNIAVTPGQIVFENDLMQLIQYAPQTDEVFETPLLIIPPWINKYYILDLRSGNSLIEWAVRQGHTVFTISWVNPDAAHANKDFEDYVHEGIIAALDAIENITGRNKVNAIGYCLGGTLLATSLSYMTAKKQDKRIASATFLTTLLDFSDCGDMRLFLDDTQLDTLEREMKAKGFLHGKEIQRTFSLMRANDLIWSFVVNNYLMGREPFPFDLLYWNDDSTNMPAAMHTFYLRNMYRDNNLVEAGGISIDGVKIDLSKIKTPAYFLSTREDHIAPWKATYQGTQLLGGDCTFTLAASGHIAGVVNPPEKKKYCYWTNGNTPDEAEDWLSPATQNDGSWWPHWQSWVKSYGGKMVPARQPKNGIEAAPGRYVKVRF